MLVSQSVMKHFTDSFFEGIEYAQGPTQEKYICDVTCKQKHDYDLCNSYDGFVYRMSLFNMAKKTGTIVLHDFTYYSKNSEKMFCEDMRKHIADLINSKAYAYRFV